MKRLVVIALMVSMSVGVVPAAEAGGKAAPREEAQEYSMPRAVGADTDIPGLLVGYALFEPGSARSVSFSVEDAASPNVLAVVAQNDRVLSTFCTSTDKPLRIAQALPLERTVSVRPRAGGSFMQPSAPATAPTFTRAPR